MTFRLVTMRHWKPGAWPYSLFELLVSTLTWDVDICSLRNTSEQLPHLLLPLTSFGPQGHKIPAEIQPRISSDERVIYRATCDSSRQNKMHSCIASASDHRAPELIAPTLNLSMERMDKRKTSVLKRETTGKTETDDG